MGVLDWLGLGRHSVEASIVSNSGATALTNEIGVASPWSEGQLQQFVWSDIFGLPTTPITREEAMSVPAYTKGRAVIITLLAGKPLRQLDGRGVTAKQPTWLYRTDGAISPQHRMSHTIDDLIWYGHSLWAVERGASTSEGFGPINSAVRVPYSRWRITEGVIELRDAENPDKWKPAQEGEVIYIPGLQEGLLEIAATNIRGAKSLEETWVDRAANPIPVTELHLTEDSMTQGEADNWVSYWRKKRQQKGGAVGMTPHNVEMNVHGDTKIELFTEGRNFARLDAASYLNLTGASLDASLSEASLTYTTTEGKSVELKERLPFWTLPIEARLSMDDVCPRGSRIRFDFSDDPTAPQVAGTGPYTED